MSERRMAATAVTVTIPPDATGEEEAQLVAAAAGQLAGAAPATYRIVRVVEDAPVDFRLVGARSGRWAA